MKKDKLVRTIIILFIALAVYFFGIKPYLSGDAFFERDRSVFNWARSMLPGNKDAYDVVVFGAEPEGITAAVSSARLGARTLLISDVSGLGGVIEKCLIPGLDIPAAANGKILNGGILAELNHNLGKSFTAQSYISVVKGLIKNEKNITIIYNAVLSSANIEENSVRSIDIKTGGEQQSIKGRVFIDATEDGVLLKACKAPYFNGSDDLNLKDTYMPVRLNFEMTGKNSALAVSEFEKNKSVLYSYFKSYNVSDLRTRINNFNITAVSDNKLVIQGLEIYGVDVGDEKKLKLAYNAAAKEAKQLGIFLTVKMKFLDGWQFNKAANSFYIPEFHHYKGLYTLSVNDILDNKFFESTIAMGSAYIDGGKLTDGNIQIIGKPYQYGIPLGCFIPQNIDNVFMTGAKASYSSLAASSAGNQATGIATGEAAGVAAVYSISKGVTLAEIVKSGNSSYYADIQKHLKKQYFYLPDMKFDNANEASWAYPAARQLLSLGLIAGGYTNNLGFSREAKESDLAILLLNGIYRTSPKDYSLELDTRLRAHFTEKPLTRDQAGAVIAALYNIKGGNLYKKACSQGYINPIIQLRLKDKKTLTMDEVYYLAAYNIMNYTGTGSLP